jgi:hypothetical protein
MTIEEKAANSQLFVVQGEGENVLEMMNAPTKSSTY